MPLPDAAAEPGWFARRRQAYVDRAAQRIFDRLVADPQSFRHAPSLAGAVLFAVAVLVAALGVVALDLWAALPPHVWWQWAILLIDLCILVAIRPRRRPLGRRGVVLEPDDAPGLYALIGFLAERVGVTPPSRVAVSYDVNAWVQLYGWRKRPLLAIGLPLWSMGTPNERCALLGHELGHLRNRDLTASRVVRSADRLLAGAVHALGPSGIGHNPREVASRKMANLVQALLVLPFQWLRLVLTRLDAAAGQQAEYLADRRAAGVAGTLACRQMLTFDVAGVWTRVAAATRRGLDPWEEFARTAPPSEEAIAAHARRSQQKPLRADASHPPDHLRIALLETSYQAGDHLPPRELMAAAEAEVVHLQGAMRARMVETLQRIYFN